MSPPSIATINLKSQSGFQSEDDDDNNNNNSDDDNGDEIGYEYLAAKARATHAQAVSGIPEHIRVKNRRKRYLELHSEYFFGGEGELNDPLLYDRLIRRFQSPAERESEGRKKGYSGVLEADIYRGEAKLQALRDPSRGSEESGVAVVYRRGPNGEILEEEKDDVPKSKEEGETRWKEEIGRRFVEGLDEGFDYKAVDEDTGLDDYKEEERVVEEKYFEEQSPEWVDGLEEERELRGETGVQDF